MAPYIHRPLGDRLLQLRDRPVLILEGARAVGKTTMVRHQLEQDAQYHYESFEDPAVRERAESDLPAWVRSLPLPTIIDEAQLVDDLPLVLKTYVDTLGFGNHFILTGSASIGRSGLGGADPLTRRSQRLTMHPLTRWELAKQNGSLIDVLFDWEPVIGRYPHENDVSLVDELRIGGFPTYVFSPAALTRGRLSNSLASDITAILSDAVAPKMDFNVTKARSVLDALLRAPGGILNAAALGNSLGIDKRTVERYVDTFGRLFLLQWLPNLATSPRKQDFARAKIHPFDLSFSVDALERAGVNVLEKREYFGQLVESYVVSQLLAHAQWSDIRVQGYYWRQAGSPTYEVDLVLIDESERSIAIEVKSTSSITSSDLKGIQAFRKSRSLYRGFVIYQGDEVLQLASDVWALPISVLGETSLFRQPVESVVPGDSNKIIAPLQVRDEVDNDLDARVFLSYVHADNEALHGRIVKFAHDLVDAYALLYGHTLQLFVDREDIAWGEDWANKLKQELGTATFLLSAVTPRYLSSNACREEVLTFSTVITQAHEPMQLLLPLMWVDISTTDVVDSNDPVRQRLLASQYEDVTSLRRVDPSSAEYYKVVEHIATRLRHTIEQRISVEQSPVSPSKSNDALSDEGPDIIDIWGQLDAAQDKLEPAARNVGEALETLTQVMSSNSLPALTNPRQAAAVFLQLGKKLESPRSNLVHSTTELSAAWNEIDKLMTDLLRLPMASDIRDELTETIKGLVRALTFPGLDDLDFMIKQMSSMSRHLRPTGQALTKAIRLIQSIQKSAETWLKALE